MSFVRPFFRTTLLATVAAIVLALPTPATIPSARAQAAQAAAQPTPSDSAKSASTKLPVAPTNGERTSAFRERSLTRSQAAGGGSGCFAIARSAANEQ